MSQKISIVAGGAGFIGVNLVSRLLREDLHVVILDNFCRGRKIFLEPFFSFAKSRITVMDLDLSDMQKTRDAFNNISKLGDITEIWHLAANSDIPAGIEDSNIDLRDTFLTTHSLLAVAKTFNVSAFHFASSSAVYGDHGNNILKESTGPLKPISNYGAMKLASEGAITASHEAFLSVANIFRFPNVVGVPATHGVIFDFIDKLSETPDILNVLGNGSQRKCYLHISDLLDGMLSIRKNCNSGTNIFNIGPADDGVTVSQIAETVVKLVRPNASISYGTGSKGWVGDVPRFTYSIDKLRHIGWKPLRSSIEAITLATQEIYDQKTLNKFVRL